MTGERIQNDPQTVRCDWENVDPNTLARWPDAVAFHRNHGNDLTKCDAWVCDCGNNTHRQGFYEQEPGIFECDRCGCLYTPDGVRHYL